jgi:hypothetical protein
MHQNESSILQSNLNTEIDSGAAKNPNTSSDSFNKTGDTHRAPFKMEESNEVLPDLERSKKT